MLYFPLHDVCFLSYSSVMERYLVPAGQAILDPPIRTGGYRVADENDDRLYRLLHRRACDMNRRHKPKY